MVYKYWLLVIIEYLYYGTLWGGVWDVYKFWRYCLSLFHNYFAFKQEWNKWSGVPSSSLQNEQREESTFLNLKSILFM